MVLDRKKAKLLIELRRNGRNTLTNISKNIHVPVSTIFDAMQKNTGGLVKKHTCVIDFDRIGFACRAHVVLRVHRDDREGMKGYLLKHPNLNSLYKINNGYDFLAEGVFKDLKGLEEFSEILEGKFRLKEKKVYYIIEDLAREIFMTDELHAEMAGVL